MSDSHPFWFHCGRCGSLFQAPAGEDEGRLCSKCGFAPATGLLEAAIATPAHVPEARQTGAEGEESVAKTRTRKRKGSHFMLKLIAGWLIVLLLIIVGARQLWRDAPQTTKPASTRVEDPVISDLDVKLLEEAGPRCTEAFSGFLNAGTPEERNQFVLDPVNTASRMARFYSLNPLVNIEPKTLRFQDQSVLEVPGSRAIESRWIGEDDKIYDAVFREENGEWRLDWDHFSRYSDYPWALFLAGSGAPEGEFRLLARERLAEERKAEQNISVVLYAPRVGRPGESGLQSPEFLVSRNKPEGRLLDAAFKAARKQQALFGSTLPRIDPEGMIRVRVTVKRTEVNLERRFEITKVSACHWLSIDDPGVVPEKNEAGEP